MTQSYRKFDDIAEAAIGYYVYALRDPRDGSVFYVGKGQRNRWYEHILEARTTTGEASLKLDRIRQIEASGHKVDAFIVRSGISSETFAYEVEAAVIHAYRLVQKSGADTGIDLTNIAEVHHPEKGLAHVEVMQTLFNAPRAPNIDVPAALFRIPRLWYPEMSALELKDATSGWWSPRSVKNGMKVAQYAFAVNRGIVRAVYKIDQSLWRERVEGDRDWEHDIGKKPRWGFPDCVEATDMDKYLNTSVKHLFKQGEASPVKFLNC